MAMEKGWKEIYMTAEAYKASIAKSILEENDIKVIVLNQHDSISESFGEYRLYVEEHFEEKAVELLKELKN